MNLVVLKFGGTSLANVKLMNNAVSRVLNEITLGNKVIIVVSAMAGVTDHLVSQAQEILKSENLETIAEYSSVITTGEQISAGLFALLLQQHGIKARSWLGWQAGIITSGRLDDGEIIAVEADEVLSSLSNEFQAAVVTGFQGVNKEKRISSLGRGGSDTTAILLAGALKAKKCDIYTDVEGVFTADPRIVAKAQKLDYICYDEMIEFALAGAKVLQAKSAILAKKYNVNLQVLSSFTSNNGTLINDKVKPSSISGIALNKENNSIAKISIIGTNICNNNLVKEAIKLVKSKEIETNNNRITISIDDEEKFDAMRILHSACKLDQQI